MIWAKNSEFCFLSNLYKLSFYGQKWVLSPIISQKWLITFDYQNFGLKKLKMAASGHLGLYLWILPKVQPADSETRHPGISIDHKKQHTIFSGLAAESCLAIRNYFFYYKELSIKIVAMTFKPILVIFNF